MVDTLKGARILVEEILVDTEAVLLEAIGKVAEEEDSSLLSELASRTLRHQPAGRHDRADRGLEICFALDALGSDVPVLMRHEIPLEDDAPVQAYLDEVAPLPVVEPAIAIADASPIRGLLRAVVHAILYATSAGVEPVRRSSAQAITRRRSETFSSDEVYFLPGAIDITQVRRMQDLERAPSGREILRRYMVRGHWRRAPQNWSDRRLRWISPHWRGPDMAAIIERAYRLKP